MTVDYDIWFIEREYDDSLRQWLLSSKDKTQESEPRLNFSPFSRVLFTTFPLNWMVWQLGTMSC